MVDRWSCLSWFDYFWHTPNLINLFLTSQLSAAFLCNCLDVTFLIFYLLRSVSHFIFLIVGGEVELENRVFSRVLLDYEQNPIMLGKKDQWSVFPGHQKYQASPLVKEVEIVLPVSHHCPQFCSKSSLCWIGAWPRGLKQLGSGTNRISQRVKRKSGFPWERDSHSGKLYAAPT